MNEIDAISVATHMYDDGYNNGRIDAIDEMLKLSEEWKNNSGSFLDFQRALRQKLKEENNGI